MIRSALQVHLMSFKASVKKFYVLLGTQSNSCYLTLAPSAHCTMCRDNLAELLHLYSIEGMAGILMNGATLLYSVTVL